MSKELHLRMQEQIAETCEKAVNGELMHLDALIKLREDRQELEKSIDLIKQYEEENSLQIQTEIEKYGGKYQGKELKCVSGKKLFSFKSVPEVQQAEEHLKNIKTKYQSAFESFQKGAILTEESQGNTMWVGPGGELYPFPELNYGKSYFTVSKK